MTLFEQLKARGLIAQCTDEEKIKDLIDNRKITFYIGFDPTADSLHVGHMLQLMIMSRMQEAGHTPIALIGGGTTMIGDPTGKTDMRRMLTLEDIEHNAERFKQQMHTLVDFSDGKAIMLNNADWILKLNYMDFLREIGIHFSVNRMLTAECFKTRLERGLTFIEFNYMLMQSYDFLLLYQNHHCVLQLGGNDQWSNIINGVDLIRRVEGKEAYGMTFTLLTTSEGKKMGKTEKGAVWLDPEKTSPYDFYQYWRNVEDGDVVRCLKLITFVPLPEIEEYEKLTGSELNGAKERLAYEVTKIVHGEAEADKAHRAAKAVFGAGGSDADMPSTGIKEENFEGGQVSAIQLLVLTGLAASRADARRLIDQGGLAIDDVRVPNIQKTYGKQDFRQGQMILKKGKKTYHRVYLA